MTTKVARANVRVVAGTEVEPELPAPSDGYQYIQDAFRPLWNQKSHYKQPWRSYLDTQPAVKLLRGLGGNFNVANAQCENAARLMAASGFTRARIEFGWNGFTYDDPSVMVPASEATLKAKIAALAKYGIRPLVLLNANSGGPCPNKSYPLTLTAEAKVGDTTIHIDPSQVAGIQIGRTGLQGGNIMGFYLFTEANVDGTIKLSQPLKVAIKAGANTTCKLMLRPPWVAAVLEDKVTPNPEFEGNMLAWLDYAGNTCRKVKELYGSDEFDVEIWNELSFGSQWLNINNYYEPDLSSAGRVAQCIYSRSVAYLRDPANGVRNVHVGNGFANQNNSNPIVPGGYALCRHPYPGVSTFPATDLTFETTALNLDGQGKFVGPIKDVPFIPTYTARFPEYFLCQLQMETRIYDIAPYKSYLVNSHVGTNPAGRAPIKASAYQPPSLDGGLTPAGYEEGTLGESGPDREVWFTEVNQYLAPGIPGFSAADYRHIETKVILRQFLAFINKGVDVMHFFCIGTGFGNYGMVDTGFYSQTATYPGDDAGGETMVALKHVAATVAGATDLAKPGALTLDGLTGGEDNSTFAGDPTRPEQYPDLPHKERFAFFPFQVNDTRRFVAAVYVMTTDIQKAYGGAGVTRFDLPREDYTLTIGGFRGIGATITAYDPIKDEAVPVTVTSRTSTSANVKLACTDYPLLITIQEG
jgi:hypothetical protein